MRRQPRLKGITDMRSCMSSLSLVGSICPSWGFFLAVSRPRSCISLHITVLPQISRLAPLLQIINFICFRSRSCWLANEVPVQQYGILPYPVVIRHLYCTVYSIPCDYACLMHKKHPALKPTQQRHLSNTKNGHTRARSRINTKNKDQVVFV